MQHKTTARHEQNQFQDIALDYQDGVSGIQTVNVCVCRWWRVLAMAYSEIFGPSGTWLCFHSEAVLVVTVRKKTVLDGVFLPIYTASWNVWTVYVSSFLRKSEHRTIGTVACCTRRWLAHRPSSRQKLMPP